MFKKIRITCDEATKICDKSQYKESSLSEKIQINIHFLSCKICRLYTKQNTKMSSLFKINSLDCKSKVNCMTDADKEILKKQLKDFK